MDHLLTTTLEDWESLGQRIIHNIQLGTVLDMTRMAKVEEKEEERAIEARNKSRCLLAPDLLTDRWTLPLPSISPCCPLCGLGQRVKRVAHPHTRSSPISASPSSCSSASRLARKRFLSYSEAAFQYPQLCLLPSTIYLLF